MHDDDEDIGSNYLGDGLAQDDDPRDDDNGRKTEEECYGNLLNTDFVVRFIYAWLDMI